MASSIKYPVSAELGARGRIRRRVRRLSLFNRILLSNAAIVMLGAVAGTWLTSIIVRRAPSEMIVPLAAGFAVIGIVLSVMVNAVVLRVALSPLAQLRMAAQAVRSGNLSVRAAVSEDADSEMTDLASTLNATLDELELGHARLRTLSSQVVHAQEEERRRVARELHDDTAQVLFAQLLRVTALKTSPESELRRVGAELEQSTVDALEGVRRLALELRPPALDDLGLTDALADLAKRLSTQAGIEIDYDHRGSRARLPADIELVLYRVAQEALTNVAKHARARHASLELDQGTSDVSLSIRDDGAGFDSSRQISPSATGIGLGLFGMRERVVLLGGNIRIWSQLGEGTEVFAFIPLDGSRTVASNGNRGFIVSEPNGNRRISIVLADDHGIVRAGLRALLDAQGDMRVVGEAGDGPSAISMAERLRPTVLIADLSMPGGGLEAIRAISDLGLPTRVLVLTVHAEERYLLPVLRSGGSGYVRKSSAHTDLLTAVRTVARGEVFLDPAATRTLLEGYLGRVRTGDERDFGEVLSDREREVVRLIAEGHTAQQAAEQLALSPKTVETYRHRAMQKLGLTNRAELVQYALRAGLLRQEDMPPLS